MSYGLLVNPALYMRPSHNLPLPLGIYPPLNIYICHCVTLPESTPSPPKYTPLLNTVKHLAYTRASQNLLLPPEGSQSMFRKFYVPKVLCSEGFIFRRFSRTVEGIHIYIGLYIIPGDVQCIRTVILLPTRGCGIFDFTNLCADLGLEVGQVDLLCPSGWGGGVRTHSTHPPPQPTALQPGHSSEKNEIG